MKDAARRLTKKYLRAAIDLFRETGQLWEKTDVLTGEPAGGECKAQPILGWTAGVFVALTNYLELQ